MGPLTTKTEDPLQPSDSTEEQGEVEAECSEDAAGAEVTLAAAASTSDLAGGRMVDECLRIGEVGVIVCVRAHVCVKERERAPAVVYLSDRIC